MLEREDLRQVRSVVKDVLREDHLDKLPDLFGREHHKHRGTHDLTFQQLVDAPDYIDNRQFITIVNEDEDGMAFVDLLGTDHQIVVTKAADAWTLSLHHQVHIYSDEEAPRVRVTNLSDTVELDPVLQFGLGSLDLIQFTIGVDDSDSDKLKIANLGALGILAEPQGSYGERLVFVHAYDDDIDYVDLSDFSTDGVLVSTTQGSGDGQLCTTPKSIAYDGVYIYQADDTNNRVQKFDAATGTFIAKVAVRRPHGLCYWNGVLYCLTSTAALSGGTYYYQLHVINPDTMTITATYDYEQGQADDELSVPKGMCTDGTNLFICDTSAGRIKKTSLTGVYVNKVGSTGTGNGQFGASSPVDCEVDGAYLYVCDYGNKRIQIFDKGSLAYVGQHPTQTVGGFAGSPASIAINDTCYYVGVHNAVPNNSYIEKYDIATRAFQASYDTIVLGSTADTLWGIEIAKFTTSLTKYGDLFVIHQDGSYIDHWPICRFMDDIRLVEGDVASGDYVGLRAPAAVGTSYALTFPADLPAGTSHVYTSAAGQLGFGQNVNTDASPTFVMLTLNQGAADDHILVVKSSDIAHGMTALEETDTYGTLSKYIATTGGLVVSGFGEAQVGVNIRGHYTTGDTTKTTSSLAPVQLAAGKKSGTSGTGDPGANENIVAMRKYDGGAGHTLWILDEDGDTWQEGIVTATRGIFNIADGTAPFTITSTTLVTNLNADLLDGSHAAAFAAATHYHDSDYISIIAAPAANHFPYQTAGGELIDSGYDASDFAAASHAILSATHNDSTVAAVTRGDIIVGSGATPKWTALAVGAAGTYLAGSATEPSWATLNQAAVAGLKIADSPNFAGLSVGTNDLVRGLLYLFGHETGGVYGGTLVCYTSADHDAVISNFGFMVKEDDLLIGPDTNIDALLLDSNDDLYITAGSLILPASEYLNFGGVLGSGSYGIRDNAGMIEFKNSGGTWAPPLASVTVHNLLSATHGDVDPDVVEEGDIIYGISPLPGWPYRKRIDLPIPDANLTDFPVEVPIIADADIGAKCLATGYDLRFTAADGVTLLPYERESFAVAGGEATGIFWVKSDVAMAGTYIWIYYGNAAATDVSESVRPANVVADGDFENWASATDLTSWGEYCPWNVGVNREATEKKRGLYSCRLDHDVDSHDVNISQSFGLTPSNQYRIWLWYKTDPLKTIRFNLWNNADNVCLVSDGTWGGPNSITIGLASAWTLYTLDFSGHASYTNYHIYFFPIAGGAAPASVYIDDFWIEDITGRSAAWLSFSLDNRSAADGGLTWGAEETTARWTRLPKGADGQVLTLVSGLPAWATP